MSTSELKIPLSKGMEAIIDSDDATIVEGACASWYACYCDGKWYARGHPKNGGRIAGKVYMHRLVFGAKKGQSIDHINGNSLDNRKKNLRLASVSQNGMNRGKPRNNTSGYKGVRRFNKKWWSSTIAVKGKVKSLGYYRTALEAALAYDKAALQLHGEFAVTNFQCPPTQKS